MPLLHPKYRFGCGTLRLSRLKLRETRAQRQILVRAKFAFVFTAIHKNSQRAVSNLKLLDGNLIISYTSEFKTLAETAGEDLGSLSYEPRGHLSLFIDMYYKAR